MDATVLQKVVWHLKEIKFGLDYNRKPLRIVMNNDNERSSFVTICNILILRGNIEILPTWRTAASYEYLSNLVAEYALQNSPSSDIFALSATLGESNLNPRFTDAMSFTTSSEQGLLELLKQIDIQLVHGRLTDPQAEALTDVQDYDSAVALIAEADRLVDENENVANTGPTNLTDEDLRKIRDAVAIRQFLQDTQLHMSYHGLFHLRDLLEPDSVVALLRNSNLSVLYKSSQHHPDLYVLVTDQALLDEPSIVWEKLNDIDGTWTSFFDSDFNWSTSDNETSSIGDAASYIDTGKVLVSDLPDEELARVLQAEEDWLLGENLLYDETRMTEADEYARQIREAHNREILRERSYGLRRNYND